MNRPISILIPGFRPDQVGATGRAIVASETPGAARDAIGLGVGDNPRFQGQKFLESGSSIGTYDFTRTGDEAFPLLRLNQFGASVAAREVQARGSGFAGLSEAGVKKSSLGQYGIRMTADLALHWSSTTSNPDALVDLRLVRGGPGILSQVHSLNPQAYHLSNTYTDANTFERLQIAATGDGYQIGSARGFVGGLNRPIYIGHSNGSGTFTAGLTVGTTGDATFSSPVTLNHAGNFSNNLTIRTSSIGSTPLRIIDNSDVTLFSLFCDPGVLQFRVAGGTLFGTASIFQNMSLRFGGAYITGKNAVGGDINQIVTKSGYGLRVRNADDSDDAPITAAAGTFSAPITCDIGGARRVEVSEESFVALRFFNSGYKIRIGGTFLGFGNGGLMVGFDFNTGNMGLASGAIIGWAPTSNYAAQPPDLTLRRGGPDILEQIRTTNPQTFHLGGTWTDANTKELLRIKATGAAYQIGSARGFVGGLNRSIEIGHSDGSDVFTSAVHVAINGDVGVGIVPTDRLHVRTTGGTLTGITIDPGGVGGGTGSSLTLKSSGLGAWISRIQVSNTNTAPVDGVMRFRHPVAGVDNQIVMTLLGGELSLQMGGLTATAAASTIIPPTSDPGVAGALWNNAGTLSISAG